MKYLGIDCGRDAVKAIMYDNNEFKKFYFNTKIIDDYDIQMLKNISILNFNPKEHIIANINNNGLKIYGKFCNKLQPEFVQLVINDDRYIEYSKDFVIISIAELLESDDEVIIGLNLTANNIGYKEMLKEYFLNNEFNVKLYNAAGVVIKDINIKIKEVGIWFQGWTSYIGLTIDDNFDINNEFINKDVLIIDIGRATVDCLYITELSNAKTISFNLGTESLYNKVCDFLYTKYNIRKNTIEISNIIMNKKKIYDKYGNEIDLNGIVSDRLDKMSNEIYNSILNNFANYNIDEYYLTGGGVYLYSEKMKELFNKRIKIIDDFLYSNANGLVKMIVRKFLKKKKGSSNNYVE